MAYLPVAGLHRAYPSAALDKSIMINCRTEYMLSQIFVSTAKIGERHLEAYGRRVFIQGSGRILKLPDIFRKKSRKTIFGDTEPSLTGGRRGPPVSVQVAELTRNGS